MICNVSPKKILDAGSSSNVSNGCSGTNWRFDCCKTNCKVLPQQVFVSC